MNPGPRINAGVAVLAALVVAAVVGVAGSKLLPSLTAIFSGTPASAAQLDLSPDTPGPLAPVGTGFTYQGRLKDGANPANGQYDFAFSLHSAPITGTLVSGPITVTNQTVTEGLFTLTLDFGSSAFNGDARYLQIKSKRTVDPSYTPLSPRQPVTPAPYALFALKTQDYKNVLVVAQSGGDFISIQAALDSITDNSFTNRYLVFVAPGIYTEQVTMKQYVNIEGAGEKSTKITSTGSPLDTTGTLIGSSSAELSFIRIENTGGDSYAKAIYNWGASPSLLHVTASASDGNTNYGIYNGNGSSPSMTNVTASASGGFNSYAVYNISSSPTMANVVASASDASVENRGVFNSGSSPIMNYVTASGSGGTSSYGVWNYTSASPIMNFVTATGSGGSSSNYGVMNSASAFPVMNYVIASGSGGTSAFGVLNDSAFATMENNIISGSGATSNFGIYNTAATGSYTVKVDNSSITGNTNTIRNDAEFTTRIGGSHMDGGAVSIGGGTVTCAGVFDENYAFFTNTCP